MKAMILAAGFGTRLKPLTQTIPKPMVPVMNRPLLERTIEQLAAANIRDIAVNVHHLPQQVMAHFGDGSKFGVDLHFSREETIMGTAGGIKAVEGFLGGGTFLVINSDILVDIDLNRVLEFHRRRGSCLTLVVREDESPNKFAPIEIGDDGRIVHFVGASLRNVPENTRRVMFTGIQIMEPEIFSRIPEGKFCGTTRDVFPKMIEEGLPVFGYLHENYWMDMGNREQYLEVHRDALAGKIHLLKNFPGSEAGEGLVSPVEMGEGCRIAPTARVGPNVVLGKGCSVKDYSVVEASVLWDGVTVGPHCRVRGSILGNGVTLAEGQQVLDESLVAVDGKADGGL